MKYIACKNVIRNSDTLCIHKTLVDDVASFCKLIINWLIDRGCDNDNLLGRVKASARLIYEGITTYSEHNEELFQIIITKKPLDVDYEVTFNYTTIGELTYKEYNGQCKNS